MTLSAGNTLQAHRLQSLQLFQVNMAKPIINWAILAASILYSLWAFGKLFSVFFVLGDNDTGLAMLSFFVFGLAPFPVSLLVLRWRKIGAFAFAATAALVAAGFVDDEMYIAGRNGQSVDTHQLITSLIAPLGPLLLFAAFYLITDVLRWPKIKMKPGVSQ